MSTAPEVVGWSRRSRNMRLGPLRARVEPRTVLAGAVLLAGTLVVTLTALRLGDYHLSTREVVDVLTGGGSDVVRQVVLDWRLPRALSAVLIGAALAVSGGVFQSLTRNPLASPDVIGFTTGSYTGALLVLLVVGGGSAQVAAGAMGGGLATTALVYLLAMRHGMQSFRLIVVGVAVSAMLGSANAYLMLKARVDEAMHAAVWGSGSLAAMTTTTVTMTAGVVLLILLGLAGVLPSVRELELGDDLAVAHGVRTRLVWALSVLLAVGLVAACTAAAGPITFVALAAPQIARRVSGRGEIPFGLAACVGAFLLASADLVAAHGLPQPVPVGLVTVVIGGAYLVRLVVAETRGRKQP